MLVFLFLLSLAVFVYAFFYEVNHFSLDRIRFSFPGRLSRTYRILHLTDIHFAGPRPGLSRFFNDLARENWDFIFITGDIFDCDAGASAAVAELRKLKSSFGSFAVYGNHDHFNYQWRDVARTLGYYPKKRNNLEILEDALWRSGFRVLRNQSVRPNLENEEILIHGLDDPVTNHADYQGVESCLDSKKFNILLTHTIDALGHLPESSIQISFSGHSHGGQVRIPGWGAFITHTKYGRKYAQGINYLKNTVCVVARGLGTSRFFKFRLFCPPQAYAVEISG